MFKMCSYLGLSLRQHGLEFGIVRAFHQYILNGLQHQLMHQYLVADIFLVELGSLELLEFL